MVIKHYLNGTEIDEPIGFDSLKMTMKRGEYHGMSAEVSEQTLEFYNTAADLIRAAYQTDLDTELTYRVTADGEEVYSGVLDLSTYEEQYSDYCSVSCKVGEVGVKTTFNNRTETEVAINGENGIDDNAIVAPLSIQTIIQPIPILYTNKWTCDKAISYTGSHTTIVLQPIFKTKVNEFGEHKLGTSSEIYVTKIDSKVPIFATDTDHPQYDVEVHLTGYMSVNCSGTINGGAVLSISSGTKTKTYNFGAKYTGNFDITLTLENCTDELYIYLNVAGGKEQGDKGGYVTNPADITISLTTDSYYKTTNLDKTGWNESIKADTTPIIEALDCICQKTAGIRAHSDWYKADFAENEYGGGGLRTITTGYKLRNAQEDFVKKDIFVSFKDMVRALSAIDCIGWGFSKEDGTICVRVERWQWFYKTGDPILRIAAPKEVKTTIDTSLIVSELTIGYKKYTSNEDIAAIDSVHTECTYTNKLKAVQSTKQALCDFIADPYAIELTRRKANEYDVSDWKYDENIFIFEIWHYLENGLWLNGVMTAGADSSNLLTGMTLNASLSPRRNAERWKKWLFFANKHSDFAFTSGEGNYQGTYRNSSKNNSAALFFDEIYRPADTDGNVIYEELELGHISMPLIAENQSITYEQGSMKAETISFTYPLSVTEYRKVKANPYGLIEVDGVLGWIKEFTYSFADGEATFKIIPKAD